MSLSVLTGQDGDDGEVERGQASEGQQWLVPYNKDQAEKEDQKSSLIIQFIQSVFEECERLMMSLCTHAAFIELFSDDFEDQRFYISSIESQTTYLVKLLQQTPVLIENRGKSSIDEATRMKILYVHGIVHDINNKLIVVLQQIELLGLDGTTVSVRPNETQIERIRNNLTAVSTMISASLEGDSRRPLPLTEVLQICQNETGGFSEATFTSTVTSTVSRGDLTATVIVSSNELGRLIFNLLDNARKANATSANIQISIVANADDSAGRSLEIRGQDNGPGFKGLEPSVASQASCAADPAHGNGIEICRGLCCRVGGSIQLVSNTRDEVRNIGAEWIITLPLK